MKNEEFELRSSASSPPPVPPWGMIGYVLRLAVLVEYLKQTRLTHILHSSFNDFFILHSTFFILELRQRDFSLFTFHFSLKKKG